jgi:hypothetical protein
MIRCKAYALALALFGVAAAQAANAPSGPGSLAGVWRNDLYRTSQRASSQDLLLLTESGQLPPLKPAAAELLAKRQKDYDTGRPYATTKSRCLPAGMPQVMFGPSLPIQILETQGQVTILVEEFRDFRVIRLNGKHNTDPDPSYFGDSVGTWQGDTLVVDTIGLTDKTALDQIGMPHSEALHVTERFRRTGPDTFTKVWTAKTSFKRLAGERLVESICENNRNPPDAEGHSTLSVPR